jgi:hypothetical protein
VIFSETGKAERETLWYLIDISAKNDLGQVEKTIEFYVMEQTASKSGSTCPSGQSLVNCECQ